MVTKLTLEYDGSGFAGRGSQPGLRTVQEELERALRTILGETGVDGRPLKLSVSGVSQKRNRRSRKIHRLPTLGRHDFHHVRVVEDGR